MGNLSVGQEQRTPKKFIKWFEIPMVDVQRAVSFYNYLYDMEMDVVELPEHAMAVFPAESGVGGALVKGQGCVPSETGPLLYLHAVDDMQVMLKRVEDAGGRVIMGKTEITDETGYFALFIDSEGNRLALHSND
ncbi:MAG: VOC family protein [Leptolyngbya sp. SIO3F4]|nr:VOC family protein [Leptolyngbya sp. SIO3F4]